MTTHGSWPRAQSFEELAGRALDEFDRAAASIAHLGDIGRNYDDADLKDAANRFLRNLSKRAHSEVPTYQTEVSEPASTLRSISSRIEPHLVRLHRRIVVTPIDSQAVAWAWTIASLLLVGAMGYAALAGSWGVAAALVMLRASGSLYAGTAKFPAENGPVGTGTPRLHVLRCVASHLGDALALTGLGLTLALANRPVWGFALSVCALVMLASTLARVASVQVGVHLYRKATERVVRRASLFVALVATGLTGGIHHDGAPMLAIAIAGPLIYAACELSRTVQCLMSGDRSASRVNLDVQTADGQWQRVPIWKAPTANPIPIGDAAGFSR
jgi:hypothetical protein